MTLAENPLKKFLRAFGECRCSSNVEREKPFRKSIFRSLGCEPLTKLENAKNSSCDNNRNTAGVEELDNLRSQAHMRHSGGVGMAEIYLNLIANQISKRLVNLRPPASQQASMPGTHLFWRN